MGSIEAVAQLVERASGKRCVAGSIPASLLPKCWFSRPLVAQCGRRKSRPITCWGTSRHPGSIPPPSMVGQWPPPTLERGNERPGRSRQPREARSQGLEALIEASRGLRLLGRLDQGAQGAVVDLPVIRPTFLDAFGLPEVPYARNSPLRSAECQPRLPLSELNFTSRACHPADCGRRPVANGRCQG